MIVMANLRQVKKINVMGRWSSIRSLLSSASFRIRTFFRGLYAWRCSFCKGRGIRGRNILDLFLGYVGPLIFPCRRVISIRFCWLRRGRIGGDWGWAWSCINRWGGRWLRRWLLQLVGGDHWILGKWGIDCACRRSCRRGRGWILVVVSCFWVYFKSCSMTCVLNNHCRKKNLDWVHHWFEEIMAFGRDWASVLCNQGDKLEISLLSIGYLCPLLYHFLKSGILELLLPRASSVSCAVSFLII